MGRYINIEKFENAPSYCPNCGNNCNHECEFFMSIFAEDIVEDVAPVVHAKWESKPADNGWKDVSCSHCNYTINVDVNCVVNHAYCPNCGAKMAKN